MALPGRIRRLLQKVGNTPEDMARILQDRPEDFAQIMTVAGIAPPGPEETRSLRQSVQRPGNVRRPEESAPQEGTPTSEHDFGQGWFQRAFEGFSGVVNDAMGREPHTERPSTAPPRAGPPAVRPEIGPVPDLVRDVLGLGQEVFGDMAAQGTPKSASTTATAAPAPATAPTPQARPEESPGAPLDLLAGMRPAPPAGQGGEAAGAAAPAAANMGNIMKALEGVVMPEAPPEPPVPRAGNPGLPGHAALPQGQLAQLMELLLGQRGRGRTLGRTLGG